jgi:signal transduction histidine kinase
MLGALTITKARGDSVTGADVRVLEDVAAGAGGLLRNIALNVDLVERAELLRLSRRRLVAAQDAERHRLERDLHDGAQQQVVALKVKLGIARTLAEREGAAQVAELVDSIADTTQQAVDSMRLVAHGIYPPLLEAEGLEAALAAFRRTMPIPVEVEANGIGRHSRQVDESVYFAVVGTLTRMADLGASQAVVELSESETGVRFLIESDVLPEDLTAVQDRTEAVGGTVEAISTIGGWLVRCEIPTTARHLEPA